MRLGRTMPRRSRSVAWAASGWLTHRKRIWPCVVVGNTTSFDWIRASSSRMVRGEFPRPARCCHISKLFHSTNARKQKDVGLDSILALVPDRANVQFIFLDTESSLGLGELDIGLPELLIAPVGDVRAQ